MMRWRERDGGDKNSELAFNVVDAISGAPIGDGAFKDSLIVLLGPIFI
jgi:hypothetical protein